MSTAAAAILAGGRSRRFGGQDKSRLVVDGHTIIVRQLEILQRVAADIFIVASDADRFRDVHIPVYPDVMPDLGTIGGLYTALHVAAADHVLVVACDQPFLDEHLLAELVTRAGDRDGAWVRTTRGTEPLLACYRKHAVGTIRKFIDAGHLKAGDLGAVLDMAEVTEQDMERFGSVADLLTNVNTPEDYARVQYRRR